MQKLVNLPEPENPHRELAQILLDGLRENRKVSGPIRSGSWPESFRLLEQKDKIPIPRIGAVLDWFISQLKTNQYLPRVYSAKSFRFKFKQIEDQKNKDPQAVLAGVVSLPDITGIVFNLQMLGWSDLLAQQLPAVVQLTFSAVQNTTNKISGYCRSNPGRPAASLEWLLFESELINPKFFTEKWWSEVHRLRLRPNDNSLLPYLFNPIEFTPRAGALLSQYGNPQAIKYWQEAIA